MTAIAAEGTKPARKRPNILFLMTDQQRGDCIGADGNRAIRTPHLDRIANEGVLFRCAYTSVPSCTPARAGLLTGLSPWRHGMLGYGRVADAYPNEKPKMLREAGYHTLGIGKMHWSPQRHLHGFHKTILDESGRSETPGFVSEYRAWFRQQAPGLNPDATGIGWNDYAAKPYALDERLHPTRWMGDTAVEFLQSYQGDEPFFLKVSFTRPHSPYDPPERFFKLYEHADLPKAVVGKWAERHAQRGQKLPSSTWRGDLGEEQVRRSRQGYYGSVSFIDEQIGRILEAIEKRGWLEDTLILVTADHGDMTGDHYLWRKTYAYEASARIPMLIRWGSTFLDARRGRVLRQPVELRDILPTFLDAAGVEVDTKRFDGRSMLDLVRGKAEGWREWIDLEHDVCYAQENHWNALTDGRWKYIYHAMHGEQQLFDLQADPGELNDLASDPAHQAALRLWRGRLVEHFAERGAPFLANGDLAPRPQRFLYGANYPRKGKQG
ncbi:MAG TPA: arylsulfatase [Planctomycetota bacterium]|nr:arylsulfatase [Planctomycetota bacterium]